jgi:hypothetical protein
LSWRKHGDISDFKNQPDVTLDVTLYSLLTNLLYGV